MVKLDEKKAKHKRERWQGIAEAAAKQSRRKTVPAVNAVMSMKEAIAYASEMDIRLIPYEMAEGMDRTKKMISGLRPGQSIEAAREAGISPITMGKRILRTETAGFTILAWIMYQLET